MKQDWMKQTRDRMGDYQRKAPEGLLDDIKQEMLRRGISPVPARRRKALVVPAWALRAAGAAALLAVALLVGTELFNAPDTSRVAREQGNPQASGQELAGREHGGNLSNDKIGEFVRQNRRIYQAKSANLSGKKPSSVFSRIASMLHQGNEDSHSPLLAEAGKAATEAGNRGTARPEVAPDGLLKNPAADQNPQEKANSQPQSRRPGQGPQQTGRKTLSSRQTVYSTGSSRNSGVRLGVYYSGMAAGASPSGIPSAEGVMHDAAPRGMSLLANSYHEEKSHHHLPVKMGFQIRYDINQRWSIQTGVSYTYLSSDFHSYTPPKEESMHRRLHFVGIPVNASYSVYRTRRLNMYLTAGGEAQKMVSGNTETETSMQGNAAAKTTEKVHMSQLQLSANAAAGVEYNLTNRLSLYAEPGASYYFRNGSQLETYYTEKPLKFNLNVGLRLNISK